MRGLYSLIHNTKLESRYRQISYSQSGEDIIAQFILGSIRNGIYIDLGAYHPIEFSNTYLFYRNGWRGYNVDPSITSIELFNKIRPRDTNICAGIGEETGEGELFVFDPPSLCTMQPEAAKEYRAMGYKMKGIRTVPFLAFGDLIDQFKIPAEVDIISIDVEGDEAVILKGIANSQIHTKIMILETLTHSIDRRQARKRDALVHEAEGMGYKLYADTYINSVLISRKFWEIQ